MVDVRGLREDRGREVNEPLNGAVFAHAIGVGAGTFSVDTSPPVAPFTAEARVRAANVQAEEERGGAHAGWKAASVSGEGGGGI
jgi:hypothetical protein